MSEDLKSMSSDDDAKFNSPEDDSTKLLRKWIEKDARRQQEIRRSQDNGEFQRTVYNPTSTFAPTSQPILAPIADPDALQTQVNNITSSFLGVNFERPDITYRKNFLATVDEKIQDLMTRTMRKCAQWNRMKNEYESLVPYDREVLRLLNEIELSVAMIGGCVGNLDGDVGGRGRSSRKGRRRSMNAPADGYAPIYDDNN